MEVGLRDHNQEIKQLLVDFNKTPIRPMEMVAFIQNVFTKQKMKSFSGFVELVNDYFRHFDFMQKNSFIFRINAVYMMAESGALPGWAQLDDGVLKVSSFIWIAACNAPMIQVEDDILFDSDALLRRAINLRLELKRG